MRGSSLWLFASCGDSDLDHRAMRYPLIALVGVIHLYFIWALGAVIGLDSMIYAQLGDAIFTGGGLEQFYRGPRYYIYQHLAPGLPVLWTSATILAGSYGWLLFTVIQHLVAGAALLYLLFVLRHFLSAPFLAAAALLVSCDPLYQSLHNRLMTESISGSMFLLGLGATIEMLRQRAVLVAPLSILTVSGMVAIQFRSQAVILFVVFFVALHFAQEKMVREARYWICVLLVVGSVCAWPGYRLAVAGQAFFPNVSYLALAHALRYNPDPSEAVIAQLRSLPLPPGLSAETIAKEGVDYAIAAKMGMQLRVSGLSEREAIAHLSRVAWSVRTDSMQIVKNQLRLPLLSIGLTYPVFWGDQDEPIHRGFTVGDYSRHVAHWRQWDGGTLRDDYTQEFEGLLAMSRNNRQTYDPVVVDELDRSLRPYFVDHSINLRDPLHLSEIPSDVWLIGWVGGLWIFWRSHPWALVVLALPVLVNYLTSVSVPIGNPRYGYFLLPMYQIGFVVIVARILGRILNTKSYPRSALQ